MGPRWMFSVLFFLLLHSRTLSYETGEVREGGMGAKIDRKMNTGDPDGTTPTTVPAEKAARGEGHFATIIEDDHVMTVKDKQPTKDRDSLSRDVEEQSKGGVQVDSDEGKRNMIVDSEIEEKNTDAESNAVKRRPILEDMEKHGHGYIKAGLDEEKRKKIEDLSMEAKARMKRYKEAEANIFDPQKATPEQLEAYAAQKQYPFVPNERTRIIDEKVYEESAAQAERFVHNEDVKEEYEHGRMFKYIPEKDSTKSKRPRYTPSDIIKDDRVYDAAKFACDDTFGNHYVKFEVADAREYEMPGSTTNARIYTIIVTLDVYFPSYQPPGDDACMVEIFTVRSTKGKLSMVSHEISPLECMATPKAKRSGRVWSNLEQKHKEL